MNEAIKNWYFGEKAHLGRARWATHHALGVAAAEWGGGSTAPPGGHAGVAHTVWVPYTLSNTSKH